MALDNDPILGYCKNWHVVRASTIIRYSVPGQKRESACIYCFKKEQ